MESPNYRAVLIGIDNYPRIPLRGCVNDIDQIEHILRDRLKVPSERITRFAAPSPSAGPRKYSPSLKPTLDEIRNFLNRLAGEVGKSDLVFLYYSGHGSRVMTEVNGQRIAREALVPVDVWNDDDPHHQRLLYDFELNGLLARIAENAGDLTVVLDCCHSASVDRDGNLEQPMEKQDRCLEIHETQILSPEDSLAKDASGMMSADGAHMLVAACRPNESAYEVGPGDSKPRQGTFSRALVQILEATDKQLPDLRWWDIWSVLMDRVGRLDPRQHPLIVGREERRLFGGPWTRRDLGYAIRQNGEGFHLGAGTLTGLSEGAEVAVYGATPDLFPALDSAADRAARIGLLRVAKADRSSCTAVAANGDFQLPEGARGRLVKPGKADRLIVELKPFDSPLAERLEAQGIVGAHTGEVGIEAHLRRENSRLHLGDDTYSDGHDGRPTLVSFPAEPGLAEAVLGHYARYRQTLRLSSRCRDLEGALEVKLLDSPDSQVSSEQLQAPGFDELPSDFEKHCRYRVQEGNGFAIQIKNLLAPDPDKPLSDHNALQVFILNCAGSGRVENLGSAHIPAGSQHVLWSDKQLGIPFCPTVATERKEIIDRLVVVGTTLANQDLSFLKVDESFAEVIQCYRNRDRSGDAKDTLPRALESSTLVEKWTAQLIALRIYK